MTKINVKNLNIHFKEKHILHDINLSMSGHGITAIVGQSGCGKSTFLKSLNRIVEEGGQLSGEILLNEADILTVQKEELRKKVGMVFQQPISFPMSIERNLSYILQYHNHYSKIQLKEKVKEYLKKVKLYEEVMADLKMPAQKLSGGQQQRLAIARCLCVEPEVLLLDEPCSALDLRNTQAIEEMLLELREYYTIILVTHNLAQAKRISDEVIFMHQGNVLEHSSREVFFQHPKTQEAKEYVHYMD